MKFYFVASRDATVSYVVQSKGFRVLVEALALPEAFDVASLDAVLLSSVAAAAALPQLLAAGFRGRVLCTEATAVLGRLGGRVQRVALGQPTPLGAGGEAVAEAVSSGLALGACNWRLRLWGRTVALLGESSLWQPRPCLPCDAVGLLRGVRLLVVAVARPALGDPARTAAELRALLVPGGPPVAVPVAALAGPALFDLLELLARELPAPPHVTLVSPHAAAVLAGAAVLGEYGEAAQLARVHAGEPPLRLQPAVLASLSLPLTPRPGALYVTTPDLLPALLAALGPAAAVLACDPAVFSSPALPPAARRVPLDCGLSAAQLRALAARAPAVLALAPTGLWPQRFRLSAPATRAGRLAGPLPAAPVARLLPEPGPDGETRLGPARARPPSLERLCRALREAGVALLQVSRDEAAGTAVVAVPALGGARVELGPLQTRLIAPSREAWLLLSQALASIDGDI